MFPTYSETFLFSLVLSFVFFNVCMSLYLLSSFLCISTKSDLACVLGHFVVIPFEHFISSLLYVHFFFARDIRFYRDTNYMFLTRHRRAILHYLAMQSF